MATMININDTLILDQTSGLQDDDDAIGNNLPGDPSLTGLSAAFIAFLNGLGGSLALSAGQKDFADNVEAVISDADYITVTQNSAAITDLFFSDAGGNALDGDQVFLDGPGGSDPMQTVDGDNVYLWSFAGGDIVLATTSNVAGAGEVVAAFYLNEAADHLSASIEYVTFIALDHPDDLDPDDTVDFTTILNVSATGSLSFDFDNLDSGNFLHVTVGTEDAGLLVSGLNPVIKPDGSLKNPGSDTINTSQGGINATIGVNNQMFVPGNTAVFSFVEGQVPGTYTDIDDLDYDDFLDVKDGTVFISQTQGNPGTNFTLKISAFSAGGAGTDPEDGRDYIDNDIGGAGDSDLGLDPGDSALKDDDPVDILRVVIRDDTDTLVTDTTTTNAFVTFNPDGSITAQGLDTGYTLQWFTDDTTTLGFETFNRFYVEAIEGKFDIGRVDTSEGITITTPVGQTLMVDDDGPTAALDTTAAVVTLDETDNDGDDPAPGGSLADVTTAISTLFSDTSSFGTDGPKDADVPEDGTDDDATTYSLVLNGANGVASGLTDTATGNSINLYKVSDSLIEGRVDTGGAADDDTVAFSIIVLNDDPTDGDAVRVIQNRAVVHDDFPDDHDENDDPEMMDPNLVLLRTTVIDDDGDTDDDDAELGARIKFEDDGPTAAIAPEDVMIVIDETDGADVPPETDPLGGDLGSVTITGANLFNHTGEDAGSDGAFDPARAYELALSAAGVDSGLVDTATGYSVFLFLVDSQTVVGREGTDATDAETGEEVIRITVDADDGDTTVTLKRAVVHDDPLDPDESTSPEVINSDVLFLKYVLTDGDQDEDDDQFDLGELIKLEDDGPTVTVSAEATELELEALDLNHDETIAPDAPDGEDTYNEPGSGADAPANRDNNGDDDDTGVTAVTVATNPANAAAIGMLMTAGSGEIGALFNVTADFGSDGEGDLDTTDGRTDTLSLVLRDASGDPVDMLETNLKVTALESDAVLSGLDATARTIWLVQVDDETVEGRIAGVDGIGGAITDDEYVAFRIELENETDLATAKLVTHHFLPIDHGGTEDPSVFDEEAELATVDEDAVLSITLVSEVEDGDDDTDEDDDFVPIVDNAGGFLSFDDDGPTGVIFDTGEVVVHDESAGSQNGDLVPLPPAGEDNNDDDQDAALPVFFANVLNQGLGVSGWAMSPGAVVTTAGTDFGTDGPAPDPDDAVWSLDVPAPNTDSGFDTLDGHDILLNVESVDIGGGTFVDVVVGRVDSDDDGSVTDADPGDVAAIAISIDQDGKLSVAQYVPIKHPTADPDEALAMNDDALLAVLTVMDADGDMHEITEPIGDKVIIEDDGPAANPTALFVVEEEHAAAGGELAGGNEDETATPDLDLDVDPNFNITTNSQTSNLGAIVNVIPGVDAPASFSLDGSAASITYLVGLGLESQGEALSYDITGNLLTAFVDEGDTVLGAGDRTVFTWQVTAAGLATFSVLDQLDHALPPVGTAVENLLTIDLTPILDVTDADDDPVTLPDDFAQYGVIDDVPIFTADIQGGTVDFEDGDSITRSLNGSVGTDENDDDDLSGDGVTKTYTFASYTASFLIDRDGDTNYDAGQDTLIRGVLSADGTMVQYFEDLDGNLATDDFGDQFYEITLDQTANSGAGSYTFEVLKDPPPAFLEFDFTDLPSGQSLHGTIAADKTDLDGLGLLVFPEGAILNPNGTYTTGQNASPTLNTSKGGGPVTIGNSNQMIDPGEGFFFVYVDNPDDDSIAGVTGGLDQNTADDADEVGFADTFTASTASIEIVQVQGGSLASMDIFAYDITLASAPLGDGIVTPPNTTVQESRDFVIDPISGAATSSATLKDITEIKVFDGDTLIFHDLQDDFLGPLVDTADVTVDFTGDKVRVGGIDAGYTILFTTNGEHDLVLVEGVGGKFDIGGLNISEAQPTPDQLYEFEVAITDFDGDQDISNKFAITVDGTGPFDSGEYVDGLLVV